MWVLWLMPLLTFTQAGEAIDVYELTGRAPLVTGFIRKAQLFTLEDNFYLTVAELPLPQSGKADCARYDMALMRRGVLSLQLHVTENGIWDVAQSDPVVERVLQKELAYHAADVTNAEAERLHSLYSKLYPKAFMKWMTIAPRCAYMSPAHDDHAFDLATEERIVCSAILPKGSDSLKLFVLFKSRRIEVFDAAGRWDAKEEVWHLSFSRKPVEEFESPFVEAFHVYPRREGGYYFLTGSGAVFAKPARVERGQPAVRPVWKDEKRPVVASLTSVDTGKSYLFVRNKDGKDEAYFELADTARSQPIQPRELPRVRATPAVRTLLEYAREIPGLLLTEK